MFLISVVITYAVLADGKFVPRIINGNDAKINAHPYQVSFEYNNSLLCGGSIISKNYILSAAHCFVIIDNIDHLSARVGSSYPSQGGRIHKVTKYIVHKGFGITDGAPVHDIAIIKVDEPFQYDETCQPIELFEANEEAIPGTKFIVTGYGLQDNFKPASQLQSVDLFIISKQDCKKIFGVLNEGQICALGDNGKGACMGDSGGPIAINDRLAGVVAWGVPGCIPGYPSVYTEVAHYRDWISEHVEL